MSSRFNSFTESRAHDRIAGRFGGFGDDVEFPEPGDCLIAVEPFFLYDWNTGEEKLRPPDLRIWSFDKNMVNVNYVEEGRTEEDVEAGFGVPHLVGGGAGIYWCAGTRRFDDEQLRFRAYPVGYELNQFGQITNRFELTDYQDPNHPFADLQEGTVIGPSGSGSIGNRGGFTVEYTRDEPSDNWKIRAGVARLRDGSVRFDSDVLDFRPEPMVGYGVPSDVPDQFPAPVAYFDGAAGHIISPIKNNNFDFVHRYAVTRDPFNIDLTSRRDIQIPIDIPDGLFDTDLYDELIYRLSWDSPFDQRNQNCAGGKNYLYAPGTLHRIDGGFPFYRIVIVRVFVDWTGEFTGNVGGARVDAIGYTDVGTTNTTSRSRVGGD